MALPRTRANAKRKSTHTERDIRKTDVGSDSGVASPQAKRRRIGRLARRDPDFEMEDETTGSPASEPITFETASDRDEDNDGDDGDDDHGNDLRPDRPLPKRRSYTVKDIRKPHRTFKPDELVARHPRHDCPVIRHGGVDWVSASDSAVNREFEARGWCTKICAICMYPCGSSTRTVSVDLAAGRVDLPACGTCGEFNLQGKVKGVAGKAKKVKEGEAAVRGSDLMMKGVANLLLDTVGAKRDLLWKSVKKALQSRATRERNKAKKAEGSGKGKAKGRGGKRVVGAESGDEGDDGEAEQDDSSQQRLAISPSANAHDVAACYDWQPPLSAHPSSRSNTARARAEKAWPTSLN